jgi:hypothetical protein
MPSPPRGARIPALMTGHLITDVRIRMIMKDGALHKAPPDA